MLDEWGTVSEDDIFRHWGNTRMDDIFRLWGKLRQSILEVEGIPGPGEWFCRPRGDFCVFFTYVEGVEISMSTIPLVGSWSIHVDSRVIRCTYQETMAALIALKSVLVEILQKKRQGLADALRDLGVTDGPEGRLGDP